MIYTKEPANKVFVFVTAYRGHESLEVNEKMLKGLARTIKTYSQDAVLVVNSQTHTAALWSIEDVGEYPQVYPRLKEVSLGGTLQQVDAPKGECYSIIDGQYWEVV